MLLLQESNNYFGKYFFVFYDVWNGFLRILRKVAESTPECQCLHKKTLSKSYFFSFLSSVRNSHAKICCAVLYFTVRMLVKTIVISSFVVVAIYSEFYRGDSSSIAVSAYSGLSVLQNFDQVAQKLAFILLPKFVLSVTYLS